MTLHQHTTAPVPGALSRDTITRLLWLDFETNGLHDRGYDVHVLEVAAVVTDANLDQLAVFEPMVIGAPESAYQSMDDYVRNMHTSNGLLAESQASTTTVQEADAALGAFVVDWFPAKGASSETPGYDYKGAVVAGSSVGSFDLRVLSERFPETRALCSHRTYDISAVNEFAVRLGVHSANTAASAASSEHRALADVYGSIAKAKSLRDALAPTPPGR
ncbi:oligoribonuclease [Nesterenkonia suensis]